MPDLPQDTLPIVGEVDSPKIHCRGAAASANGLSPVGVQKMQEGELLRSAAMLAVRGGGTETEASASYLSGLVDNTRIDNCDAASWLQRLPVRCDLIFGSPPYTNARLYRDDSGKSTPMFKDAWEWASWMATIYELALRKCNGIVAFVVAGRTRQFSYNGAPHILVAELLRRGVCVRNPCIFHRRGISGSGGPDYLRSDYEHIVVATNGGKLPWSDNTSCGHAPKYGPGGAMSHRLSNGSRRNAWGGTAKSGGERRPSGKRNPARRSDDLAAVGEVPAGYRPPKIANPGNVFYVPVGGGLMGHPLAHKNEAPFPEGIVRPFVLSFCRPGGIVADPFAGSGTTLAVAKKLGRIGIGCDLRVNQCEITKERLASVTWQEDVK